jgi:hypothetical protein
MAPRLILENTLGGEEELDGLELLELGGAPRRRGPRAELGQLGDVLGFFFNLLSDGVGLLAKIVGAPLDVIGSAATAVIDAMAGLVGKIPWVGDLLAQVLVVGKVIINAVLKIPETLLKALSNIIGSFAKLPADKQKSLTEGAVGKLVGLAKQRGLERQARQAFDQNPPTAGGADVLPPPRTVGGQPAYLRVLAGVGIPAALAGAVAVLG